MRFTNQGHLEIGDSESSTMLQLGGDKISFIDNNGGEVASISNNELNITHARIETS